MKDKKNKLEQPKIQIVLDKGKIAHVEMFGETNTILEIIDYDNIKNTDKLLTDSEGSKFSRKVFC